MPSAHLLLFNNISPPRLHQHTSSLLSKVGLLKFASQLQKVQLKSQLETISTVKMHIPLLTSLLLLLSTLTLSAPASSTVSKALVFNTELPWKLRNIIIFNAAENSTFGSHISFHFEDPNEGNAVTANCTRSTLPNQSLMSNFYSSCSLANNAVRFQYDKNSIAIMRYVHDAR
jgi:hypothetical protein